MVRMVSDCTNFLQMVSNINRSRDTKVSDNLGFTNKTTFNKVKHKVRRKLIAASCVLNGINYI